MRKNLKKAKLWSFSSIFFLLLLGIVTCRAAANNVVISEVMYNPEGNDDKHEWAEIENRGEEVIIITGAGANSWRFFDGSNHIFNLYQGSNILKPGQFAVLARDPATFLSDYPHFEGAIFKVSMNLSNRGEILKLSFDKGITWFSETEYISLFGANGNGKSLEKDGTVFRESFIIGGTPGKKNSKKDNEPRLNEYTNSVYLSEIYPHPASAKATAGKPPEEEFIELYNPTSEDVNLDNWKLDDEPNSGSSEYTISSSRNGGSIIKPSGFLVFPKTETGISMNDSGGDLARLIDPNGREVSQTPNYGAAKEEYTFSRDEKGIWHWTKIITTIVKSPTTTVISTTSITTSVVSASSLSPVAVTTATPLATTTSSLAFKEEEGKIKGIEIAAKEKKWLKGIRYILDGSVFLLLFLTGDWLWKNQKAKIKSQK